MREFESGPTPEWTGAPSSGGFAGSGNAEAQLTAIAKQIAAERRIPFAPAHVAESESDLVRGLREHEAPLARRT